MATWVANGRTRSSSCDATSTVAPAPIAEHGFANHQAAQGRKRIDKEPAVAAADDARVQDDDHAAVVAVANQATEALFELEHGLRHRIPEKGVAACCIDGLGSGAAGENSSNAGSTSSH